MNVVANLWKSLLCNAYNGPASIKIVRCLSGRVKVPKELLSELRKRTGFALNKCHASLAQHDNNLEEAEKWLYAQAEKEGWSKANKLQSRQTTEGLIGIYNNGIYSAMVEVNCETDFVARNENFGDLMNQVALTTYHHGRGLVQKSDVPTVIRYGKDDLGQLIGYNAERSLVDLAAALIGKIGENIIVRRGVFVAAPSTGQLGSYVHSIGSPTNSQTWSVGKYGAIVILGTNVSVDGVTSDTHELNSSFGRALSQHIVGMNPIRIARDANSNEIDENALLDQAFLLDSSIVVGELIKQKQIQILNFVRYHCGESE